MYLLFHSRWPLPSAPPLCRYLNRPTASSSIPSPPPSMATHFEAYRSVLVKDTNYVGAPSFFANAGWRQVGPGHVLCRKMSSKPYIGCVVGRVLDSRLNVTPDANYNGRYPLKDAKYGFVLCRPDEPLFASDWDRACKTLKDIQTSISSTQYHVNFLSVQKSLSSLRFVSPLFEKRDPEETEEEHTLRGLFRHPPVSFY